MGFMELQDNRSLHSDLCRIQIILLRDIKRPFLSFSKFRLLIRSLFWKRCKSKCFGLTFQKILCGFHLVLEAFYEKHCKIAADSNTGAI